MNSKIQQIVNSVLKKEEIETKQEITKFVKEKKKNKFGWDVPLGETIEYFDPELSYELTGYKPIDETRGLDFDPEWFVESRNNKKRTGKYCEAPPGTKVYSDFWKKEYLRCRNGLTINGYTITGDNYFFLNYYQLMNLNNTEKAGGGRVSDFASFYVKQYEYFHYIELCKRLRKNAIGLKGRGLGFSEIGACIAVNTYNCRRKTHTVIAAQKDDYLSRTLDKCWEQLHYLNKETEGGFKKIRQVHNTALWKKASVIQGKDEVGWQSDILGIIADIPNKIRGDRTDLLIYEESGSWVNFKKAWGTGDALVGIIGKKFGIKIGWGTGGDSGKNLEGLADAIYNPDVYDALPYRHNFVENKEYVLTGYFIPSHSLVDIPGLIDHRGWTDPKKGKEFYEKERDKKRSDPQALFIYSAEYCFTIEEALQLEGADVFGSVALSEQLININVHKIEPPQGKIQTGFLEYIYDGSGNHKLENVKGFKWIENPNGKIHVLEKPLNSEDEQFRNLYVAGIDGIDLGASETSENTRDPSDFCVVIKKRVFGQGSPTYVCYYKDRPDDIVEAYKTTLKLLQWYNCKAVLESSKISVLTWFRTVGMANKYLMKRPRSCLSDIQRGRSNLFGAQATEVVINHQLNLIKNYCREYSYDIWFPQMLEELIKYSIENKRKFDIVAAMGMCELGDEELLGLTVQVDKSSPESISHLGYWTDENGIKHYGPLPHKQIPFEYGKIDNSQYEDYRRIRTSDPRYNNGWI